MKANSIINQVAIAAIVVEVILLLVAIFVGIQLVLS
jgi:hypothetical protein